MTNTDCPRCSAGYYDENYLEITAEFDKDSDLVDGPVKLVWVECESDSCDYETGLALIYFPDGRYDGISDCTEVDAGCADCGDDAEWHVEPNGNWDRFVCDECVSPLRRNIYRTAVISYDKQR